METALCAFDGAKYLIFADHVPALVYYSHIPVTLFAILLGAFVYFQNRKSLQNRLLFWMFFFFSVWVFCDSVFWATNQPPVVMFVWAITILVEPLTYLCAAYLVKLFLSKEDLSPGIKWSALALYAPLAILVPTHYVLSGFDLSSCLANETLFSYYTYVIEGVSLLYIIGFGIIFYRNAASERKKEIFYFVTGIVFFLLMFAWGNITGSFTDDWQLGQFGLFGTPVMIAFLGYIIVKYKSFKTKLMGVQALVVGLWGLIFSLLFLEQSLAVQVITCITLLLVTILGANLIRSVKREIESREKIETLAKNLERSNEELADANSRLKELDQQKSEFVSLASHQLRSPLTAIRGYASLILEGEFGEVNEVLKEPLSKISESVKAMIIMVEDFLSVSRIEQGRMKFDFTDFDLRKLTEDVVYELRPNADKAGLELSFSAEPGKKFMVSADLVKIKQVIINFLDNSIKYTPKGSIAVSIKKSPYDKILIAIKDTGIGMSATTIPKLFNKFTRAALANKTNVQGTGLGLYVAKQMIEAHKGKVWAESEGEGKGSTFFIELQGK